MNNSGRLSLRKLLAYVGASLGALVLVVAVLILMFGGAILNGYGKGKIERAFAKAHPGCTLRIGELDYSVGADRLVAQSVTLSATNATLTIGRISLTGVRWAQLLWGTAAPADFLAKAGFDATNLDVEFPEARYGIRCARLRASVPGSELIAEDAELQPLAGDDAFFAAHAYRATRFHVVVPECRVLGLQFDELLRGKACRATSVHISRPTFDALVNCDQPAEAFVKSPLMVHEALALIRQPLKIDSLKITKGHLTYCERAVAGADPGVLTVAAVNIYAEGIANRGAATAVIQLRGQGSLMNAGMINVLMTIPITPADFSLHCSGSLGGMDLTRLDAFLAIAAQTSIKSGSAQEATFEMNVTAGQARGRVRAIYKDFEIAVLNKQTGSARGWGDRLASLFENVVKIRNANPPNALGAIKQGEVNYTRRPDEEFQEFLWFALRTGILDLVSH